MTRLLRSLARDVRGAVAVYVVIVTPVLLGIAALTLDLGRLMSVDTQLQSGADAAALAGAAELDRFSGARDRARATAAGAVANLQTFATGGADITIDTSDCADPPVAPCIRFLESLPASDGDPITALNLAASDEEARFIDVHVAARTVTNVFIRLVGGPAVSSTSATAVAGNDQVICNIPAMWMCNPTEDPDNTDLEDSVDIPALEGRQLKMFVQASGGKYGPGNFGLLCPLGTEDKSNCGAGLTKEALASTEGTCVGLESMTVKPGVTMSAVRAGINARMDYYTAQAKDKDNNSWRSQSKYMPAANVTQGGKKSGGGGSSTKCEYSDLPADVATKLPRDQSFDSSRVGDGNWDYKEYFRINHGCDPSTDPTCKPADWKPADWDGVTGGAGWPPTRYETYRYELETPSIVTANQSIYDSSGNLVGLTQENGNPQCYTGSPAPPIPGYNYYPGQNRDKELLNDRRIFPITTVNCYALEASGIEVKGRFSFKPPEMAYVFLTEPMPPPSADGKVDLYVEVLGALDEGAQNSLTRDVVQLYRR